MVISATVLPLKTTSGSGKAGNSVRERRLTSNTTVTVERRDTWRKRLQKSDKRPRLARTRKPEIEIWQKPHKRTPSTRLPFDFNTIYGPICHRLIVKTTFDFGKTGNSVGERRLTSNAIPNGPTVTISGARDLRKRR